MQRLVVMANVAELSRSLSEEQEPSPPSRPRMVRAVTADGAGGGWLIAGRYRVTALLGRGGMADVFCAYDGLLHRDVAVKVFAAGQDVQRRADREMRTLASLRHANLITVLDAGTDTTDRARRLPYLVMELVDGPTLAQRIADGPLDPAETAELGAQIATALSYVHDQGIVHRDIKPANILLAPHPSGGGRWTAKLTDFGIARVRDAAPLTMTGLTIGTANYVSPEQALGRAIRPSSDIYSLGLVLLEALTGQRAFSGPALSVALARIDHPPRVPAQLGPDWVRLLTAMIAQDPEARPSAVEVSAALQEMRAGQTSPIVLGPLDTLLGGGVGRDAEWANASPSKPEQLISSEKSVFRRAARWIVFTALAGAILAISIVATGAIRSSHQAPTTPAGTTGPTTRPQVVTPLSTASPAGRPNTTSRGHAPPTVPAAPPLPPRTSLSNKSSRPSASTVTSTSDKGPARTVASSPARSTTSAGTTASSQSASAGPTPSASTPPTSASVPPPSPTPDASPDGTASVPPTP